MNLIGYFFNSFLIFFWIFGSHKLRKTPQTPISVGLIFREFIFILVVLVFHIRALIQKKTLIQKHNEIIYLLLMSATIAVTKDEQITASITDIQYSISFAKFMPWTLHKMSRREKKQKKTKTHREGNKNKAETPNIFLFVFKKTNKKKKQTHSVSELQPHLFKLKGHTSIKWFTITSFLYRYINI